MLAAQLMSNATHEREKHVFSLRHSRNDNGPIGARDERLSILLPRNANVDTDTIVLALDVIATCSSESERNGISRFMAHICPYKRAHFKAGFQLLRRSIRLKIGHVNNFQMRTSRLLCLDTISASLAQCVATILLKKQGTRTIGFTAKVYARRKDRQFSAKRGGVARALNANFEKQP